ncbi:MAG TPA: DUF488 family protein [Candidatus Acidoferrum sp.]|nr:DUF488 family protein [Candidatus Acidoferrum sp.]
MTRIQRIYKPFTKKDGWRVLVDRLWPRGLKKRAARVDHWMKEIAPSDGLRKWFGHKARRWTEFQKRYRAELAGKKELIKTLREAEKTHGTVTLLFGAKDEAHNQAVVLRQALKGKA